LAKNPPIGFAVDGLREIDRALRQLGGEQRAELRATNKRAAQELLRRVMPNVPVGSVKYRSGKKVPGGSLKRSVKQVVTTTSAGAKVGTPSRVPYGAAIHWGARGWPKRADSQSMASNARRRGQRQHQAAHRGGTLKAQPFLWNAVQDMKRDGYYQRVYIDELEDLMRRYGLK
jgi:hypothetical protein